MAEAGVQFGDGIRPVKTTQSRTFDVNAHPALAQKAREYDSEEKAIQVANEDLSRKNKQVYYHVPYFERTEADLGQTYAGWTLVSHPYPSRRR